PLPLDRPTRFPPRHRLALAAPTAADRRGRPPHPVLTAPPPPRSSDTRHPTPALSSPAPIDGRELGWTPSCRLGPSRRSCSPWTSAPPPAAPASTMAAPAGWQTSASRSATLHGQPLTAAPSWTPTTCSDR